MIKNLWFRFHGSFVANPVGAKVLEWFIRPVDKVLLRLSQGRYSVGLGKPIELLTTTGRKSGLEWTLHVRNGDEIVQIASNYGKIQHPSWYLNLSAKRTATPDEHDF